MVVSIQDLNLPQALIQYSVLSHLREAAEAAAKVRDLVPTPVALVDPVAESVYQAQVAQAILPQHLLHRVIPAGQEVISVLLITIMEAVAVEPAL
jgi:hypothetical protein